MATLDDGLNAGLMVDVIPAAAATFNDASLPVKERNAAWKEYEKSACKGKGFFYRLNWKMTHKPMELICKCDLRGVMHGLVGGTVFFAYTVITSHAGSQVAFALAVLNWCCLGLETNLLRLFLCNPLLRGLCHVRRLTLQSRSKPCDILVGRPGCYGCE